MLPAIHIRKISTTPRVNGKLRKLCAYFAHLRPGGERLGPSSGNSSGLPNVMLSPEIARMMKQVAVIQCTKRSNALKRTKRAPGAAGLELHHAAER